MDAVEPAAVPPVLDPAEDRLVFARTERERLRETGAFLF
jgi:hypothetical protein